MKKYITLLILVVFTILSCEKDDICIDATTPSLIFRFYDNDSQTDLKQIKLDSVWVEGKIKIQAYVNVSLDSIAIPIDLNENNTTYIIENNAVKDTLKFSYTKNDVFVSRSCGYKTIFDNLQIDSYTTNWIKNISINNSTIDNETSAHLSIFH
ncbi:MAG: hypothetical protein COB01_06940 [Lutibacter sp.]|nr:MAG: hypothetical protein COB01_06940 [Lutibacter sp.]